MGGGCSTWFPSLHHSDLNQPSVGILRPNPSLNSDPAASDCVLAPWQLSLPFSANPGWVGGLFLAGMLCEGIAWIRVLR